MSIMKKITALCLILFTSITAAQSKHVVLELPNDDIQLLYEKPPRLEQVLHDLHSDNKARSIYQFPIAMQLFNRDRQDEANALKTRVLSKLQQASTRYPKLKTSIGWR